MTSYHLELYLPWHCLQTSSSPTMTLVYTPEGGGATEATATPSSKPDNDQKQQLPATTSVTATVTAPSYSPIYSAAQPASMSSLPAATESVRGQQEPQTQPESLPEPEHSTSVYTPSETTNPTPATTTSSSPPPQPGAVPVAGAQGQGFGYGQKEVQGQGVPPPPKVGEAVAQGGVAEGATPAATATASPNINPGIQFPTQPYGYGYGYASQQQYPQFQQPPNATTTPYNTVYPRHPSISYQTPYTIPNNNNIMQDELDTGEKGLLDMAKGWMQTAGEKLIQVEAEVWRRINEAHDGEQ
ncbi:uncharacterized protein ACHE_11514A [Aspergillus chevalieri]|uniref:Uncharacterized protein n=1 Tax=Aspergillus chevalieri TaxID=182096 RepID=A0A7R7VGX0_ASPCH|nr:uncharacterized protein ACHE_11514A [Aspergillus chevalieri]BCR84112.1 hypothetical protein ACHE_11514A [Aspergillus chevalieri]